MKYRHYKNHDLYSIVHSRALYTGDDLKDETIKLLVVYYQIANPSIVYVRPYKEFFGTVNGVKRFQPVDETNEAKEKCY